MNRLKKIMVVDDEASIRNLLSDVLTKEGYRVTMAKDGQDALKQLRNRCYDLLITDMNMPRLDGIGLLRKMTRAGRKERIVLMSGDILDHSDLIGEIPNLFVHLKKPFHMKHLLETISSAFAWDRRKRRAIGSDRRGKKAINAV